MRRLDQRGVAAFEFCLVAVSFFILIFVIFDLGRYAITVQSLRALANAGARAIMINCYTDAAIQRTSPTGCGGDPLPSDDAKKAVAPFLYNGGLAPTLGAEVEVEVDPPPPPGRTVIVVTSSQPGFTMLMPIWGSSFDHPSASAKIPFPASSS
jgi:hypothetical protein